MGWLRYEPLGSLLEQTPRTILEVTFMSELPFDHIDFSGARFTHSVFRCVPFVGCDLRGAELTVATFLRCDLRGALFDAATVLHGSRFDGSNVLGVEGLTRAGRAQVKRRFRVPRLGSAVGGADGCVTV